MTNERDPRPDEAYKPVFIKESKGRRWYTQTRMNEDDYMNLSLVWKKLRLEKIRMNPVCELCQGANQVQVHHLRYPEIWGEEEIEDLMTLCDSCHSNIHGKTV